MDRRWAVGLGAAVVVGLVGVRVAVERLARAGPRLPRPVAARPLPSLPPPIRSSSRSSLVSPGRSRPPEPVARASDGTAPIGVRPAPVPAVPPVERGGVRVEAEGDPGGVATGTGPPEPLSTREILAREGFGAVAAVFDGRRANARRPWREELRRLRVEERELRTALRDAPEGDAVWIREQLVQVRAQRKEAKRLARAPSNGPAPTPEGAARWSPVPYGRGRGGHSR